MENRSSEVTRKVSRLSRAAAEAGLRGVVLFAHWNFSWLSAGASNRIDISREAGAGALVVGADGRRLVLANAIEMPRLMTESLAGLGFEPVEFSWTDERADPSLVIRRAVQLLGGASVGVDLWSAAASASHLQAFESELSRLRSSLDPEEIGRYRTLGADVGQAVGAVLGTVRPGSSELDLVRDVGMAVCQIGARPLVLLAAGDERLLRYRHPIPTAQAWTQRVMVAVCAERDGLVVALSRLLSTHPPDREIVRRLAAAQYVFTALLRASHGGASARALFRTAATAYAEAGFPGEETKHHQGGLTGYRSREWIAHPQSPDHVALPAALAWNPSVTGTKVEDTCLVTEAGVEVITQTPGWPCSRADVNGRTISIPDHLVLEP